MRNSQSGQSTIEFALTLLFMFGMILFYLQLTLVFSYGNYVHYATFMSARALLSSGPDEDDQQIRAKDVANQMLTRGGAPRFPFIATPDPSFGDNGLAVGNGDQFRADNRLYSWMQGVRYRFRSRLFVLPLLGSATAGSANSVTLTSESWLGREPSTQECVNDMGDNFYDNGC